jgi:ferredoxin-NADP reductase
MVIPGKSSGTTVTDSAPRRRLVWREAEVAGIVVETPHAKSVTLRVPGWPGHVPGQHVDVRLTADDGYQAQRSYSIASPPAGTGEGSDRIVLTIERIDDGEVSPFLTEELRAGDQIEVRGPIGGYFTWTGAAGRPLQLLAGGSGIVPLMAMLRHRARAVAPSPARLLYSSRTWPTTIYRAELARLAASDGGLIVTHALTRATPPGWTGQSRRIDGPMLRALALSADEAPEVFVCGPTPFVESVATSLVEWGHAPPAIKTERFGPTGGPPQEETDGPNG